MKEARLVSAPVGSVNAPSLVPTIAPTVTTSSNTPFREARTPHSTVVVDVQLVLAQGRLRESPREEVAVKQAPKLSPAIVTVPPVRPTFQAQADENPGAENEKCNSEPLSHASTHTRFTRFTRFTQAGSFKGAPSNVNFCDLVPTIVPTVTASPVVPARDERTLQLTVVPDVQLVQLHAWLTESSSEEVGDRSNKTPNCSPDIVTDPSPVRPMFHRYV